MYLFIQRNDALAAQHVLLAVTSEDDALCCLYFNEMPAQAQKQVRWALTQGPVLCLYLSSEPVQCWRTWLLSHGVCPTALNIIALDVDSLDAAHAMSFETGASLQTA